VLARDLRSAATRHDALLSARLNTLVPGLMERADLDAWVLMSGEYAEDPVLATMLPATWLGTARRLTILLFIRASDGTVSRHAVARYAVGDAFPAEWDPELQPDQLKRLGELLLDANPQRIGLDISRTFPLADGLTAGSRDAVVAKLPAQLAERLVSAEAAAIGWLETRLPEERDTMAEACHESHAYLRRALSAEVIVPGRTTTADVEWWLRDAVASAARGTWFHPTVSVQQHGGVARRSFAAPPAEVAIMPGDLVHIDFGIVADGYCTDQQQHAYVLRPGEKEAPDGLRIAIARANRLQDLLMAQFAAGRTGNEILRQTRDAARAEGIDGLVYTHAIGLHGHAAGPTIGLWDAQDGVLGQGDYAVYPGTAYSIELQARSAVPEWDGQIVQAMLEEDAWFDGEACTFMDGRQTELWLI
jgi:Xaa-Pro aminopeptidase